MGYEERPASSSSAAIVVVVVVAVIMIMLIILALGLGALFYVRAESRQTAVRAEIAEVEAVRQQASARAELERGRVVAAQTLTQSSAEEKPSSRQIVIALDADGHLTVDGQRTPLDDLRGVLEKAQPGQAAAVSVTIEADGRCPFQQVADVQTLCRELGIQTVELKAVKPAPKEAESEKRE